jgi:serine/threonine-protein kinase
VKLLRTAGLDGALRDEYLARFRVEARAAGSCLHPSIVLIYDFGETAEGPYLVMELVEGPTFAELLRQPGPGGAARLVALLPAVLDGLASAHALGIIHRDIKPANLMLAESGQPKIADFGVAKLPLGALTTVGGMLGTPSYMAPEQARGEAVDLRADLFGVAAILHEALLGRPPFAGNGLVDTLRRLTGPEPAELGALAGSPWQAVLRRGLAKEREARFASAAEFATALRAALAAPDAASPTLVLPAAATPDPAFLDRLTEELRPTLGPVAGALVRRTAAALGPAGEDALLRRIAAALDQPEDRRAFLRRHRVDPVPGAATGTPAVAALGSGIAWPEPALAAAQAALAFHLGPIAKLLVRRAAAEASNLDALLDRLEAHLPDQAVAPTFRRRLKAQLEALPHPRG